MNTGWLDNPNDEAAAHDDGYACAVCLDTGVLDLDPIEDVHVTCVVCPVCRPDVFYAIGPEPGGEQP